MGFHQEGTGTGAISLHPAGHIPAVHGEPAADEAGAREGEYESAQGTVAEVFETRRGFESVEWDAHRTENGP